MNVTVHMAESQADQTRKPPPSGFVYRLFMAGISSLKSLQSTRYHNAS